MTYFDTSIDHNCETYCVIIYIYLFIIVFIFCFSLCLHSAPGTAPRNVRAHAVSSNSIIVSWEEPEIPNGIIKVINFMFILFFAHFSL